MLHLLPASTVQSAPCNDCCCVAVGSETVPITELALHRSGCIQPGHDAFWCSLEHDPNSGITHRPSVVTEAHAAFCAAESSAAGASVVFDHHAGCDAFDDEDNEEEPELLMMQQLVMGTTSLNRSLGRKRPVEEGAGASSKAPAAPKKACTLEGKLRKEVLRKQPPAKTDMLQFIDTLPQNDDGSARISRLGENGKAAQAAVLQARLKAYFEATAP